MGWRSGRDGHAQNEPFRTGISRSHVPEDYMAIVRLGEKLNMRPQAAMVLCEWDKRNILCNLPHSTWMGENWDNKTWVGRWMDDAADIIRKNNTHIEPVMHGTGHEYWENGILSRAEFHDMDNNLRPPKEVEAHLCYFFQIMKQHNFGGTIESFVPPAFRYCLGDGFTEKLKQNGIKYISTMFRCMKNADRAEEKYFGKENGVMIVDRGTDITGWNDMDVYPKGEIPGPVCGLHWPNILHPDYGRNDEVVDRWVQFLKPYDEKFERMLARNTAVCWTQLAYNAFTDIKITDKEIMFDFSGIRHCPENLLNWFTIKIKSREKIRFFSKDLEVVSRLQNSNCGYQALEIKRVGTEDNARLLSLA